jgi:hypothetical protein
VGYDAVTGLMLFVFHRNVVPFEGSSPGIMTARP